MEASSKEKCPDYEWPFRNVKWKINGHSVILPLRFLAVSWRDPSPDPWSRQSRGMFELFNS
jgi:hypothetical protein